MFGPANERCVGSRAEAPPVRRRDHRDDAEAAEGRRRSLMLVHDPVQHVDFGLRLAHASQHAVSPPRQRHALGIDPRGKGRVLRAQLRSRSRLSDASRVVVREPADRHCSAERLQLLDRATAKCSESETSIGSRRFAACCSNHSATAGGMVASRYAWTGCPCSSICRRNRYCSTCMRLNSASTCGSISRAAPSPILALERVERFTHDRDARRRRGQPPASPHPVQSFCRSRWSCCPAHRSRRGTCPRS